MLSDLILDQLLRSRHWYTKGSRILYLYINYVFEIN